MKYPSAYFNFTYYVIEPALITQQNDAARSDLNDKPVGEVYMPSHRMSKHVQRCQRLTAGYSLR